MLALVFASALFQESLTMSQPPLPDRHTVSHEIVCGASALGFRYTQSIRPADAGGVVSEVLIVVSAAHGAGETISARLSGRFSAIGEVGAQCRSPGGAMVRFTAAEPDGPFQVYELILDEHADLHLVDIHRQ